MCATFHASADAVFARHLAALSGPDAEAHLLRDMELSMPELGGTTVTAAQSQIAKFVLAYSLNRDAALRAKLIGCAPVTTTTLPAPAGLAPTIAAASPVAAKAHAARPTMTARPPVKQAAQAEPSLTQMAKEGVGKVRQDERRQQIIEEEREQDERRQLLEAEEQQLDAEPAADLSDNDRPR